LLLLKRIQINFVHIYNELSFHLQYQSINAIRLLSEWIYLIAFCWLSLLLILTNYNQFCFQISGHLHNTGQFLVFRADREAKIRVNITGGPLAYHYQFEEIYIHYGMDDGHGSEHRINNYAFPAEVSRTNQYQKYSG